MKKNRMMRLASALLMCVLLTTSVIGGTFAKYVTTGTASDTARVAKWGVTIAATGAMFAESYKNDAAIGSTVIGDGNSVNTDSTNKSNLVAPGTKGTLASATITGTPEVAVHVEHKATLTLTGWTVNSAEYFPLIIKVGETTYGIKDMKDSTGTAPTQECDSISALITAVKSAIETSSADYPPNTNLSTAGYGSVSWEWAFDKNDNAKDTALGNAITPATIKLEITTTVTQID